VRADRLVSLVLLLQARRRTTAQALAKELEVSVRTVYRDLEALSAAGVPVFTESGPGGGCQLLDGYRFPLRGLRPEEAEALLILGVPSVIGELGLESAVMAAHRQIRVTAGQDEDAALVHLDMPRWFRGQEEVPHLRTLAEALRRRQHLALGYARGDGPAGDGPAGEGRAGDGPAGEGRAGEGRAGEGRAGEGRAGEGRAGEGRAGDGPAGEGRAGEGRAGEGRAGEGRAGEGRAGSAATRSDDPPGEGRAGSAATRVVGPLGLVNKAGTWYLVAATRSGRVAVFRAGRISSARVLVDKPFERPADFGLPEFWERWSAEFTSSRPRLPVRLRASPEALAVFGEIFGDDARPALDAALPPDEQGWQVVTLSFEHELAAAHRLAGFGGRVEVLSPPSVRERLLATAREILGRYGS
jgi:predicted DNA-binding transcriptional regulator YafY